MAFNLKNTLTKAFTAVALCVGLTGLTGCFETRGFQRSGTRVEIRVGSPYNRHHYYRPHNHYYPRYNPRGNYHHRHH